MKDYSKFIPSSFGYIIKYEIVGDEIHVYTPETKKGEPHKYPATKENIAYYEKRMETQYKLALENREVIEKHFLKGFIDKVWKIFLGIEITLIIAFVSFFVFNSLAFIAAGVGMLLTLCIAQSIVDTKKKKFNKEMDMFQVYLKNRHDIEQTSQIDKNVTEYLSQDATKKLTTNQTLQQEDKIDTTFTVDFMDNAKFKDLQNLLLRYMISKGLLEEQKFTVPTDEQEKKKPQVKKKTLTKKNTTKN